MRVFHGFENLPSFRSPAATVGSYDGVHSGHRVLLDRIRREAAAVGGESIVLTFDPHPRVTLGTQERLRLLTSLEEKIYLLDRFGIDNLIVIPFDRAFSRIPSESFVKDYLIGKVGVKNLVVVGFMTHMCINSTARGAFNLGYAVTVPAAATATRALPAPDGSVVEAAALQVAALTALADLFAVVVADGAAIPD